MHRHEPPRTADLARLRAHQGPGIATQVEHRFSRQSRSALAMDEDQDIWWSAGDEDEGDAPPVSTQVMLEDARSALASNDSPDIFFEQSVNPYRGCEHGCVYCYARPTHSYLNLSPGLDFETKIIAKRNIAEVLRKELSSPSHRPSIVNIGSATDCYQPVERELRLTRGVMQVMRDARHPFSLITKSSGVERDLDLLGELAGNRLVAAYVTITTLDAKLARILEPRAAAPYRRLRTIRALAQAGVPVGVSVAPQIPFINEDMEQVLIAASEAGATSAFYTVLRLPWELNDIMREWLVQHYPDRAARVLSRVQDLHGVNEAGRDAGLSYDSNYVSRMKGSGVWADLLRQRFHRTCEKLGLNRERTELDLSQYRPALAKGQGVLF
ncbi:PA0069 family radical SAM protein [Diaphorobacter aerolatus]|uniref:PA0069 family radical SAM protein n=1 Tax=Diaphorobacter aerolatus TaxID=1288495 RepID=A0A7H0GQ42_9BURK|nr:PA0069 family radical SAM protein [Diaphorobacter aerolatus]QNP50408.1 PA0069 family radical SAM protein [Diaphorobacter aerolatus]